MMDTLNYYFIIFLELCGLEEITFYQVPGLIVTLMAIAVVIYAFYRAVITTLWPGEVSRQHIKYRILEEDW